MHVKEAIKLDWTTDLEDRARRDFANEAQVEALLSKRVVANDDLLGIHGRQQQASFATYACRSSKLYGHWT